MRTLLGSKIHRATVTHADLHYVGSLTIDRTLMAAAGIVEYDAVPPDQRSGREPVRGG